MSRNRRHSSHVWISPDGRSCQVLARPSKAAARGINQALVECGLPQWVTFGYRPSRLILHEPRWMVGPKVHGRDSDISKYRVRQYMTIGPNGHW